MKTERRGPRGLGDIGGGKLTPEQKTKLQRLVTKRGTDKAAAQLGTGWATVVKLLGGGAARGDTMARLTAAIDALPSREDDHPAPGEGAAF